MPPRGRGRPILKPSTAENLIEREGSTRLALSHTQLSSFLNCPRRWQLSYEERLELISTREPLLYGRAFQLGIEHNDPEVAYRSVIQADYGTQAEYDRLVVRAHTVRAAAKAYLTRWPAPTGEQREFGYRVRLRNPWTGYFSRTFDLLGYADGIRITPSDTIELVENKFVSQITEVSIRRLPLDRQLQLAAYGLWRATGRKVEQVSYRFVRKPSIQQRKDETLTQFVTRLEADYEERPDFYTHEESLFRSDEDLLRIECELWEWSQQVLAARTKSFAPRNTSHCADFGGCDFIPICVGEPDARDLYRVRPPRTDTVPSDAPLPSAR